MLVVITQTQAQVLRCWERLARRAIMSGLEHFIRFGMVHTPTRGLYQPQRLSRKNSHSRRKLWAWPKDLQLELIADSEISTLDIQAWIRQTKAPLVRLGHTDGTDKRYFDKLIKAIRNARGVSFAD